MLQDDELEDVVIALDALDECEVTLETWTHRIGELYRGNPQPDAEGIMAPL